MEKCLESASPLTFAFHSSYNQACAQTKAQRSVRFLGRRTDSEHLESELKYLLWLSEFVFINI